MSSTTISRKLSQGETFQLFLSFRLVKNVLIDFLRKCSSAEDIKLEFMDFSGCTIGPKLKWMEFDGGEKTSQNRNVMSTRCGADLRGIPTEQQKSARLTFCVREQNAALSFSLLSDFLVFFSSRSLRSNLSATRGVSSFTEFKSLD